MACRLPGRRRTLPEPHAALVQSLRAVVGRRGLITRAGACRRYTTGYRVGEGRALAVVRPATLGELWRTAEACANARAIIIVQAANTGLTGGSTPWGQYDRPVVLISTERLGGVIPIGDGREAICLAGSTLTELEDAIRHFDRLPHSVIGSSCLGASVVGGICNNSGGALVQRGPAFSRHSLFGRIDETGELVLVNHLGRDLGHDPLAMLDSGMAGGDQATSVVPDRSEQADSYEHHVRDIDAATPARHNADPRGLYEASGSAGKVIVFAVRVPTFPAPQAEATFLFATDDAPALAELRVALLSMLPRLPDNCEYLHRSATEMALSHGADICHALRLLGPSRMPQLLKGQKALDAFGRRFGLGAHLAGHLAQAAVKISPPPLPGDLRARMVAHEHVLLLTASDGAIDDVRRLAAVSIAHGRMSAQELGPDDAAAAYRVRFASAGATVRYRDVRSGAGELAALDIALPRNAEDFRVELPPHLRDMVLAEAVYGHFLCHVFHLDYVLRRDADRQLFEAEIKGLIEGRGGQMPAEHNFGQIYEAPAHVAEFYRSLDPTNSLNPGIGKTSRRRAWA